MILSPILKPIPAYPVFICGARDDVFRYRIFDDADKIAGMIDSACAKVDIGYYEHGTVTVRSDYSQYLPVEQERERVFHG